MKFGFSLDKKFYIRANIEIRPLRDIEESISSFYESARVSKGWLYPEEEDADQSILEKRLNIPCTLTPKFFRMEPTHEIIINPSDPEKLKFLILCLGFINGVFLTPADQYYLGKIPYEEGVLTGVRPIEDDVEKGMEVCSSFYDKEVKKRKGMKAILHWFLSGQYYDFPWDRFNAQYKVLDALYKLSGLKAKNHAERAELLAGKFGVKPPNWVKVNKRKSELSKLRNALEHEAIYADEPIGFGRPDENYDLFFPKFNIKIIAATLGLKSSYLESSPNDRQLHWWGFE